MSSCDEHFECRNQPECIHDQMAREMCEPTPRERKADRRCAPKLRNPTHPEGDMSDEPRGFIGFEVAHYCDATCYATGCTNRGPILLYERAFTMLRRLEWNSHGLCEVCHGVDPTRITTSPKGHKPNCDLDVLLRELP